MHGSWVKIKTTLKDGQMEQLVQLHSQRPRDLKKLTTRSSCSSLVQLLDKRLLAGRKLEAISMLQLEIDLLILSLISSINNCLHLQEDKVTGKFGLVWFTRFSFPI